MIVNCNVIRSFFRIEKTNVAELTRLIHTHRSAALVITSTLNSPGKVRFHLEQIATEFFLPQRVSMRSPEHHTKSPKKSQYGKVPNLHNSKWPPNFNNLLYLGS